MAVNHVRIAELKRQLNLALEDWHGPAFKPAEMVQRWNRIMDVAAKLKAAQLEEKT